MSNYKDKILSLSCVTLDTIANVCGDMLPYEYKKRPYALAYSQDKSDKNRFAKVFSQENELNGYAAAYTGWHKDKLRIAFDQAPEETFVGNSVLNVLQGKEKRVGL